MLGEGAQPAFGPERTVKRMYTARIVVLVIALGAGGVAAYLASGVDNKPPAPVQQVVQVETVDVLVAKSEIALGQTTKAEDLRWQTWPKSAASGSFIRRNDRPDAINQIAGSIARAPIMADEPIREQKLVKADGSGFMAAILPTGMRAISTEISAETGAGGFILPNDRVDVILTRRIKNPDNPAQPEIVTATLLLSNIRVLAIDQAPKEKDGQNALVGRTVTLELKPEQTGTLAAGRQAGTLSLALRSIADANAVETTTSQANGEGVNVIRYGVASRAASQK
jgi:pilus assembly protein CpaB